MTLLAALKGHYDRLADDEDSGIAPYGYSPEKIWFALLLSKEGEALRFEDLRVESGKKLIPRVLMVPKDPRVTRTSAVTANFLWDKTAYALGVTREARDRTAREHDCFRTLHSDLLAEVEDAGLRALLAFLAKWVPDEIRRFPERDEVIDTNIVFRLEGERGFLHETRAARDLWSRTLAISKTIEGLCLVTGETGPIARLHPLIKGVRGAQPGGAALVSADKDGTAFHSYGKVQGLVSPVSEATAAAYTTALNHLLKPDYVNAKGRPQYRTRVQIADTSTVFWAESQNAEKASAAEALFGGMVDPPGDADEESEPQTRIDPGKVAKLRSVLNQIAEGRPLEDAARDLAVEVEAGTRLFVLGLAPNAARIAVRFWYEDTLGNLARHFGEHYRDLAIDPPLRGARLPGVRRLLYETAVQRKAENIPPNLSGEVMRAILTGGRYPRTLLAAVVMRMRADGAITGLRAAICKACFARDFRKGIEKEDVPMALDRTNPNPGYRLGRLFAVLESIQSAALGNVNATIRDRYYGAASASPASVFPLLIRGSRNHLANLRKGRAAGWVRNPGVAARWYEKEIGQILDGLDPDLPRSFPIGDQGRFAVGYYHQRFSRKQDAPEDVTAADSAEATDESEN